MAIDDRYKRASAMHLIVPYMHGCHTDTTAAVSKEERWAVTWMYMGIAIAAISITYDPHNDDAAFIILYEEEEY